MAAVDSGLVGILPDHRRSQTDLPTGGLDPQAHSEILLAALAYASRPEAQAAIPGIEGSPAESCLQQPRSVASCRYRQPEHGPVQRISAPLRLLTAVGSCGHPTPLTSTAGCGKPHVRWCGKEQGRNPLPPTRSRT